MAVELELVPGFSRILWYVAVVILRGLREFCQHRRFGTSGAVVTAVVALAAMKCNVYTQDLILGAASGGADGTSGGRGGANTSRGGAPSGGNSARRTQGGTSSSPTSLPESGGDSAAGGTSSSPLGTLGGAAGASLLGGAPNGGFAGGTTGGFGGLWTSPWGGNGGTNLAGAGGVGNSGGITATAGGTTTGSKTGIGGTTAVGGTFGCGVSAGGSAACMSSNQLVVDDLEDGDQFIRSCNGRHGNWYVYRVPPGGNSSPAPGAPVNPVAVTDASTTGVNGKLAMHLNSDGTKAGEYGIGFSLNGSDTCKTTIDLSAYAGIRFMYKADLLPANASPLRFQIPIAATSSIENGGTCPATVTCDNDHFSVELAASTAWRVVTVAFDPNYSGSDAVKLSRQATTGVTAFDAKTVLTMQFNVHSTIDQAKFSVWVDNFVLVNSL